jgi:trigger factor
VGDTAVIDIAGELDGEPAPGLTAQEYSYEVGSGGIVDEVDAQLTGASAGDELSFDAKHPVREDATLQFEIVVREVRERILPEADDAFAAEVSEFETLAELRDDLVDRARRVRRAQAAALVRERTGEAIAALVTDDVPDALVDSELNQRLQDMTMRLQAQGIDLGTWLAMQNRDPEEFVAELRSSADGGAKLDLALRAIATAEGIEVTDADLDQEWADVAERVGVSADEVRERFEATEQVGDVRVDIVKRKAFDWVSERVTIVDESGTIIDRASLDAPEPGTVSDEPVETAGTTDADDAADDSKGDDE